MPARFRHGLLVAGLALVGAGLAACGSSDPAGKTPGAQSQVAPAKPAERAAGKAGPAGSSQRKQAAGSSAKQAAPKQAAPAEPSRKRDIASAKAQHQKAATTGGTLSSVCGLVSPAEAATILGKAVRAPVVAKQGPTCLYRTRAGDLTTVSVQSAPLRELAAHMRNQHDVAVASRAGVCGTLGQPVLYLPVGGRKVLAVTGKCDVARQFASHALPRLITP
jgi:hypothetical protein